MTSTDLLSSAADSSAEWDTMNFNDEEFDEIFKTTSGQEGGEINFDDEMDVDLFMNIDVDDCECDVVVGLVSSSNDLAGSSLEGLIKDEEMMDCCELPSFVGSSSSSSSGGPSAPNSRPSTPPPQADENDRTYPSRRSSLVTPEPSQHDSEDERSVEQNLPHPEDLKRQFDETLKKLAKSMRLSDVSRSAVKKQLKSPQLKSFSEQLEDSSSEFFLGKKYGEVVKERKRLMKMISRTRRQRAASA